VGLLVLGIDPGTRSVGYGLVRMEAGRCSAVDHGFFRVDHKLHFPHRLKQIHGFVSDLLDKHRPDVLAVEEVYVSQNAKTTLRLGHARGVILLAAVEKGIPVAEYAPREVKQAVLGSGGASKDQVQWMMAQMLRIRTEDLQEDAADGLAVALCHGLRESGCRAQLERRKA
jgi:crossover junction endodeoxyribonuclease RuvC